MLALAGAGLLARGHTQSPGGFQVALSADGFQDVDEHGNIRHPDRVRDTFPSLGATWVNGDPEGEMHLVWATAGTAAAYRLNHQFADGAVLVKEVLAGAHGRMTTGQANWASDETKVWFVMIKDRKGRYPGNPLWVADGAGRSSRVTRRTRRSRPTIARTACHVIGPRAPRTGCTSTAIQC